MKTGALFFPAVYPDAMQPGEYVSTGYATSIACPACGVVQPLLRIDLIHPCASESCPASYWVELVPGQAA